MDGLMLFKLAQSAVDPQRVYVLAIKRTDNPAAARATTGIYTSADAGQNWQLATSLAAFPTQTVFTIATGTASAGRVFAIVPGLGDHGLYASDDAGGHWRALAPAPPATLTGVAGDPGNPRHLLLWSVVSGRFLSGGPGARWVAASGVYVGLSYPLGVEATTTGGTSWRTVLP